MKPDLLDKMARPKKVGNARELEQQDTVFWCGLIKAQSGLSDAQIETKLELVVDPNGRSFNRWLNGKRAMTHNDIQKVVRRAREVGLLKQKKQLGSYLEAAIERRAGVSETGRASDNLQKTLKSLRELHEAKRALDQAALDFQKAAAVAADHGVEIFDTIKEAPDSCPDELLEHCNIDAISTRVSEIASWYFFEGGAHGFD